MCKGLGGDARARHATRGVGKRAPIRVAQGPRGFGVPLGAADPPAATPVGRSPQRQAQFCAPAPPSEKSLRRAFWHGAAERGLLWIESGAALFLAAGYAAARGFAIPALKSRGFALWRERPLAALLGLGLVGLVLDCGRLTGTWQGIFSRRE